MENDIPAAPDIPKRRSRSELKELMLDAGVDVLNANGMEIQISSVSYARVFEHLEETAGIRVTYGSVHERIWDSLQDYQLAVVERAGLWNSTSTTQGWQAWARMVVAMTSQPPGGVADMAAAGARNRYRNLERSVAEEMGLDGSGEQRAMAAHLSIAIRDGLNLRRTVTGESEPTIMLATGPGGELEEWDGHALAVRGLLDALAGLGAPATPM